MADYGSFNKVLLIGRIASQIHAKNSKKGTAVSWFNLATDEIYAGEHKPRPSFHRIVCFGKRAEFILKYGTLGSLIAIEGKIHKRSWNDAKGVPQSITEISAEQTIMLRIYPSRKEPKAVEDVEAKADIEEAEGRPEDDEPLNRSDKKRKGHVCGKIPS